MLQEGLLWFDDSKTRTLVDKIKLAVERYQQKHHCNPDVCYVHPAALDGQYLGIGGVKVLPSKSVLPYHFWLGIEPVKKAKE